MVMQLKKSDKENISVVKTKVFQETIIKICKERCDEWATEVFANIQGIRDCAAAEQKYHIVCYDNFRNRKHKPIRYSSINIEKEKGIKRKSVGPPNDDEKLSAFKKTIEYFEESEIEVFTISELCTKMQSFCGEPYSAVYLKKKLLEHYGDEIEITERLGEEDLYTFTNILWRIVQRFHSQQSSSDVEQEKIRIIETAAKLI